MILYYEYMGREAIENQDAADAGIWQGLLGVSFMIN